jgi:hypothetical protein
MSIKKLTASMLVAGLIGGTAIAAQQRGDVAGLKDRYENPESNQVYTKSGESWFTQAINVNAQLNVDVGFSDSVKVDPNYGRQGPFGLFPGAATAFTGFNFTNAQVPFSSQDIRLGNSNISVDIQADTWVNGHIEVLAHELRNDRDVKRTGAWFDEAYFVLGDLNEMPLFLSGGRMYTPFYVYGEYNPSARNVNAGNPHRLSRTLPQYLAEMNETALNLGCVNCLSQVAGDEYEIGLDISGYVFRGVEKNISATNPNAEINNGGVDVGLQANFNDISVMIQGGWVYNILDSLAFSGSPANGYFPIGGYNKNVNGWSAYGAIVFPLPNDMDMFDGNLEFDIRGGYVTASDSFAGRVGTPSAEGNTTVNKPTAWEIEGGITFPAFERTHRLAVSYQDTKEGVAFGLPDYRIAASFKVLDLAEDTTLEIRYEHDKDYKDDVSAVVGGVGTATGSGRSSNTVMARLGVGFL